MTQQSPFRCGQRVAVTVSNRHTKSGEITAPYATGAYVETGEGRVAYYRNSQIIPVKRSWPDTATSLWNHDHEAAINTCSPHSQRCTVGRIGEVQDPEF